MRTSLTVPLEKRQGVFVTANSHSITNREFHPTIVQIQEPINYSRPRYLDSEQVNRFLTSIAGLTIDSNKIAKNWLNLDCCRFKSHYQREIFRIKVHTREKILKHINPDWKPEELRRVAATDEFEYYLSLNHTDKCQYFKEETYERFH